MRLREIPNFTSVPKEYDVKWMERFVSVLEEVLAENARTINGTLGFGDGIDFDNLIGKWVTYTTNAIADTEDTLTHDLGAVPIGFITMKPPASGFIYRGPTVWTTSKLYLKCSAANQTALIFVIQASHGVQTL